MTTKKVHILLSKKEFDDLMELKKKLKVNMITDNNNKDPKTYEEYLEKEKKEPTMALIG